MRLTVPVPCHPVPVSADNGQAPCQSRALQVRYERKKGEAKGKGKGKERKGKRQKQKRQRERRQRRRERVSSIPGYGKECKTEIEAQILEDL